MSPDPQATDTGWQSLAAVLAALGGLGTGAAAFFRGRGQRGAVTGLRKRVEDIEDTHHKLDLKMAVVETTQTTLNQRLDRIENKLDRALGQR